MSTAPVARFRPRGLDDPRYEPCAPEGFYLEGCRHPQIVGHAPRGGRHVQDGPIDPNPFAFIFAGALVIDNSGAGTAATTRGWPCLKDGDVIEIEGYGLHRVVRQPWCDECRIEKVGSVTCHACGRPMKGDGGAGGIYVCPVQGCWKEKA